MNMKLEFVPEVRALRQLRVNPIIVTGYGKTRHMGENLVTDRALRHPDRAHFVHLRYKREITVERRCYVRICILSAYYDRSDLEDSLVPRPRPKKG